MLKPYRPTFYFFAEAYEISDTISDSYKLDAFGPIINDAVMVNASLAEKYTTSNIIRYSETLTGLVANDENGKRPMIAFK